MQQVAVEVVGPEMFERTRHRLSHLNWKRGRRIVGQAMVLAVLIGEFCLQEKVVAS